jgi:hypothetical protein
MYYSMILSTPKDTFVEEIGERKRRNKSIRGGMDSKGCCPCNNQKKSFLKSQAP